MARARVSQLRQQGAPTGDSPDVLLVCEHALIRDALFMAFRDHGISSLPLPASASSQQLDVARQWALSQQPNCGLLVTELDEATQLFDAVSLLEAVSLAWLVLTSLPPGPAWGALLDAGAAEILPTSMSLDDLTVRIRSLRTGRETLARHEREELVLSWRRIADEQHMLHQLLVQLSARELEILKELQSGHSVRVIAARSGVAEATVRAQVKSLLRKLRVNSQLQAVACYRKATAWLTDE